MARTRQPPPSPESREFRSIAEIDTAIAKLKRRITEVEQLDIQAAVLQDTGADNVAESNIRATIREIFGANSPEFQEHQYIQIWAGGLYVNMSSGAVIQAKERGRTQTIGIMKGLIGRLEEKREDLVGGATPAPSTYFDRLRDRGCGCYGVERVYR